MAWVPPPRFLRELLAACPAARLVHGDGQTPIADVTHDSRQVVPGSLFVAVPGLQRNGLAFVPQAIERGAAAIAAEQPVEIDGPLVVVPDARAALADLAAAFYDHPSRHLPVVGITGTDGKTSTTHLLSAILEAHGLQTGWLTTVNTRLGAEVRANAAEHTTPEAPLVQRTLAEMRARGVHVAILETSSHALALDRVRAVHFQVGVFTNLSPEHLNFHGSMEAYAAAKARLFERLPADGLAVLNADDPHSATMRAATRAPVLAYGLAASADLSATDLRLGPSGTRFTLQPAGLDVHSHLIGRFNVANWLAAYGAARHLGAAVGDLARAAAEQQPVPGRMNLVDCGQPFSVVVDFAHTPQALDKAIETIRALGARHLLLVFGLAGGRDQANRPTMGALAAAKTDFFVITMDDPGDEDPATIAEQIAAGAQAAGARPGQDFLVELDRRAAIRLLFERAAPGDAVLLAGKGHEQRMVVSGGRRLPWSDAGTARALLEERGFPSSQAVL
jgi:UDP-N-acetylmuramoyl-L-alanyl-D-glutamate--2,6-diaminopimelate ligase